MKITHSLVLAWAGACAFGGAVNAAPLEVLNYDLTAGGTESSPTGTSGNTFTYTVSGYDLEVSAWAEVGSGTLEDATAVHVGTQAGDSTLGFGVCNSAELPLNDCLTKGGGKDRVIDNKSQTDWILLLLPEWMTLNSFSIKPEGNDLRAVTYFTGRIDSRSDIDGRTYDQLEGFTLGRGFDPRISESQGKGTGEVTFNLSHDGYRNAVLIGGSLTTANANFTLTNFNVTTVPVPASLWLLLTGLAGLAARVRRQSA